MQDGWPDLKEQWCYAPSEICEAWQKYKLKFGYSLTRQPGIRSGPPAAATGWLGPPRPQQHLASGVAIHLITLRGHQGWTDPATERNWWACHYTWAWEYDFFLEV